MRFVSVVGLLVLSCACSKSAGGGSSNPNSPTTGATAASCAAQPYSPAAGVSGSVTGSLQTDCAGWVDVAGAQFTMTLTQQTNLDFTLAASGFNGVLALYTDKNVKISQTVGNGQHIVALLPAGVYRISVGTTNNGGPFTLSSPPVTTLADSCQSPNLLAHTLVGATFSTTFAPSACVTTIFLHGVVAAQTLTFTMTPDQPMEFGLFSGVPALVQRTMPKNVATTVTYTLTGSGDYRIGVCGSTGSTPPINYTLSIR